MHIDYGDMHLNVALDSTFTEDTQRQLKKSLATIPGVQLVANTAEADWLLQKSQESLSLVSAENWIQDSEASGHETRNSGTTALDDSDATAAWLRDRLTRIARARNLLRVSGASRSAKDRGWLSSLPGGNRTRLKVKLLKLKNEADEIGTEIKWSSSGVQLQAGELIALKIENPTRFEIDFSVMFVDSGYGITSLFPDADTVVDNRLPAGESFLLGPLEVEDSSFGLEHLIVIGVKSSGQPVDFSWLAQNSLEQVRSIAQTQARIERSLESPLSKLLQSAVFAEGNTRGVSMKSVSNISMRVVSWQTINQRDE